MNTAKTISLTLGLCLALGLTACSDGYAVNGSKDSTSQSLSQVDTQMDNLEPDLASLDTELADAQSKISGLTILSLGTLTTNATGDSISDKITAALNNVLAAVNDVVSKEAEIRAKIDAIAAKLDPNNLNDAKLQAKVDEIRAYLDQMKTKIVAARTTLVNLIDSKVTAIDSSLASMSPSNPITIIASIAWSSLKAKIIDLRDKIAAIQI